MKIKFSDKVRFSISYMRMAGNEEVELIKTGFKSISHLTSGDMQSWTFAREGQVRNKTMRDIYTKSAIGAFMIK